MKEGEFLKKRGKEFWERAFEDIEKERFNLSAFDFEQALQLWLKYLIFLKAGDFPKIHFLTQLIEYVIEIYKSDKLKKFYNENRLAIKMIEDSYITSRYFSREFKKEEAEEIKKISLKLVEVLENETKIKLI
jgi:HEPN domain-containing protein